jgi:hypothetical protein
MKTIISIVIVSFVFIQMQGQSSIPPVVSKDYKAWTSSNELNRWLLKLADIYTVEMRLFRGNKEVDMPVVVIPAVQDNPLTVMIIAEQHGDEPSGMEACNLLISELLSGELPTWTDSVEWIIVPMVNAEGHESKLRKKNNGADLNRDHLILSQPETRYVHYMYNRYMPDVFIDMHEYPFESANETQPFEKRIQQQVGCVTNINLKDKELDAMAHEFILPHVAQIMAKSKVSFSEYLIGSGHTGKNVRLSTVDIDDARQGIGAMGRSLSFIVEGLNGKNRNDSIFYRTQAQFKCLVSLVEGCQLKKDSIKKLVQLNRENAEFNPMSSVSIQMDHFLPNPNEKQQTLKMNYWSIKSNRDTILDLGALYLSEVRTIKSIEPPLGYWISKKDERLVNWVQAHEAGIFPFSIGGNKKVIGTPENTILQCIVALPEWQTQTLEGMHVPLWSPEWIEMKGPNTKDYVFVSTQTLNGLRWIMALEPDSMFSLARYPEFENLRYQYPILRVTSR